MKFNVHGRFQIEVTRERENWIVYRIGNGMRIPDRDIAIPASIEPNEILIFLDDIFHELAGPTTAVQLIREPD
jgi:hypothetical protein